MRRFLLVVMALLMAGLGAMPAAALQAVECNEVYKGVVCQGAFTDEPGIATDRQRIEDNTVRVGAQHGVEFALVVVQDSRGDDPADFAQDLGKAGGVGDPEKQNGLVVLVELDERYP